MILTRWTSAILAWRAADHEAWPLDPHPWIPGGEIVGAKRPEGWLPPRFVLRRGIRAGASPRATPERQILVDTQ